MRAYLIAVERVFGPEGCSFGTIDKTFSIDAVPEAARRYSPDLTLLYAAHYNFCRVHEALR